MKGPPKTLTVTTDSFDLASLVSGTLQIQDSAELDHALSLSPLTPLSSPALSSTSLQEESIFDIDVDSPVGAEAVLDQQPQPSSSKTIAKPSKPMQQKKNPDRVLPPQRRAKRNASSSALRKRKREAQKENSPRIMDHHVSNAKKVQCGVKTDSLPIAQGAHIGVDDGFRSRKRFSLEDFVGDGAKDKFRLQEWDGESSFALVDTEGRVVVILAGHPDDKDWPALHQLAAEEMETRRSRCYVPKKGKRAKSRRGEFIALRCGVSHGGGQKRPGVLHNEPQDVQVLDELNSLEPFKRLAGFATSVIRTWCPDLYECYKENVDALRERYPELAPVFPNSIHSGFSYNLGPETVCYPHTDFGNYAVGMCGITLFGPYDYKAGGHLVLWDLKLVIEFPPGSTILLPSAIMRHSNVAIQAHERRYSFAQYSAGGLFRWVDNDFQTQDLYKASLSPEQLEAYNVKQDSRLAHSLSLLRTVA